MEKEVWASSSQVLAKTGSGSVRQKNFLKRVKKAVVASSDEVEGMEDEEVGGVR